jgi:hypothetical protein
MKSEFTAETRRGFFSRPPRKAKNTSDRDVAVRFFFVFSVSEFLLPISRVPDPFC